jgi:hypothetical protein
MRCRAGHSSCHPCCHPLPLRCRRRRGRLQPARPPRHTAHCSRVGRKGQLLVGQLDSGTCPYAARGLADRCWHGAQQLHSAGTGRGSPAAAHLSRQSSGRLLALSSLPVLVVNSSAAVDRGSSISSQMPAAAAALQTGAQPRHTQLQLQAHLPKQRSPLPAGPAGSSCSAGVAVRLPTPRCPLPHFVCRHLLLLLLPGAAEPTLSALATGGRNVTLLALPTAAVKAPAAGPSSGAGLGAGWWAPGWCHRCRGTLTPPPPPVPRPCA